jgi:ABC-type anion transport system duplicated permease subunit
MITRVELATGVRRHVAVAHHVAMQWYTAHANPVSLRVDTIPIQVIDVFRYISVVL